MCYRLLSFKNYVFKKYYVKVDKKIDSEILFNYSLIKINDDFIVLKYILEFIDDKGCFLIIYEGKFY